MEIPFSTCRQLIVNKIRLAGHKLSYYKADALDKAARELNSISIVEPELIPLYVWDGLGLYK